MTALTITFRQAKEAGACTDSYRAMAEHVGGIAAFGRDTPLPIETVLGVCGLDDALWALDAIHADRVLRMFACDCAERTLPIFERGSADSRPREVIRVARLSAHGLATEDQRVAASDAAWAAASDAARAAAWAAAPDAAWAAEKQWQADRLRDYLRGES